MDVSGQRIPMTIVACLLQTVVGAMLLVSSLPFAVTFFAFDLPGTAYMVNPLIFGSANAILQRRGDDAMRNVTLYSMNIRSMVLWTFWDIVFYSAENAPYWKTGSIGPRYARLYAVCLHLALGASIWGCNIGVLSSILVHPGWRAAMNEPDASERGAITGVYYLSTLLSYVFLSHPLADWLGRRYAAMVGTLALAFGATLMAGAQGIEAMALGRWICGTGVDVVSTTVLLYQR